MALHAYAWAAMSCIRMSGYKNSQEILRRQSVGSVTRFLMVIDSVTLPGMQGRHSSCIVDCDPPMTGSSPFKTFLYYSDQSVSHIYLIGTVRALKLYFHWLFMISGTNKITLGE